ncbi:hypothetical protein UPYG_G00060290 [Umbra pygmaea]|uniref:Uncharacterized protein n=1 Tax=Umbra pygmaea TaxID=75934 RepID=A0ABD0XU22_UMBPY
MTSCNFLQILLRIGEMKPSTHGHASIIQTAKTTLFSQSGVPQGGVRSTGEQVTGVWRSPWRNRHRSEELGVQGKISYGDSDSGVRRVSTCNDGPFLPGDVWVGRGGKVVSGEKETKVSLFRRGACVSGWGAGV